MNIQNIAALAGKLEELGFGNMGYLLLKKISFRPESFSLPVKNGQSNSPLRFQIFIQRKGKSGEYELMYYDAFLQPDSIKMKSLIAGVDISVLRNAMTKIDWRNAFDFTAGKHLSINEQSNWETEQEIESVIEQLESLEKSDDGKIVSTTLKLEFWSGLPYQELFGNITPVKNKDDIWQRFYFAMGQPGISVDEAYRFLQSRLLEKQILLRKRQPDNLEAEENSDGSQASTGSGLLRKKRIAGKGNSKKKNQ